MKTVYIVGGGWGGYNEMWNELGFATKGKLDRETTVACFTGGEDVSPYLYGQKAHRATYNNHHRDAEEIHVHAQCVHAGIPMVGICRGGQFLNVMSGGEMYQDVGKHAVGRGHILVDNHRGLELLVSSTHHQMMMPGRDSVVLATAKLGGFREWYEDDVLKADISQEDIEVVAYPNLKTLCFQPHPEFNGPQWKAMRAYFASLVDELLED